MECSTPSQAIRHYLDKLSNHFHRTMKKMTQDSLAAAVEQEWFYDVGDLHMYKASSGQHAYRIQLYLAIVEQDVENPLASLDASSALTSYFASDVDATAHITTNEPLLRYIEHPHSYLNTLFHQAAPIIKNTESRWMVIEFTAFQAEKNKESYGKLQRVISTHRST